MYENLQEYYHIRTSCHIVQQVGRDFFCNCRKGMKGKLCIETMAFTYSRVPQFEVHKNIDTVHFKRGRRPVGRPRRIGGALSVAVPHALEEGRHTGLGVAEVQVVQFEEEVAKQRNPSRNHYSCSRDYQPFSGDHCSRYSCTCSRDHHPLPFYYSHISPGPADVACVSY